MEAQPSVSSSSSQQGKQEISFSHVQLFVDRFADLRVYQDLEQSLNEFHGRVLSEQIESLEQKRQIWSEISKRTSSAFAPHNRDIVTQLMVGFGFRVTRIRHSCHNKSTKSLVVTARDPKGVQFMVTALTADKEDPLTPTQGCCGMFSQGKFRRFMDAHNGHMGIGVLAFAVQNVDAVKARYERLHPALIDSYEHFGAKVKVLEVFAYYKKHATDAEKRVPDPGTVLRFIECPNHSDDGDDTLYASLGFEKVDAVFDSCSYPAYSDHWVSNVFSRTEFLDTLEETLDFFPQANFNAGVVAAGEAQIESTVTGNISKHVTANKQEALRDQSQIYLPINNALSSVGHVHGFLEQLGQGVQHIASRVENLVDFVQLANENRRVTGEGFSFLRIPRSYYGVLSVSDDLLPVVSHDCATAILNALTVGNAMTSDGAVDLDLSQKEMDDIILSAHLPESLMPEYRRHKSQILDKISFSRYKSMYSLLGRHVSEPTYLAIVRNQILVDVQGEDLLYQIFTCYILQRQPGDEAPFLEFIQRVCSECSDENGCPQKIRPGCGGFGIRNFLTLFLSIEVSKAMQEASDAKDAGDVERENYANAMVDCFTSQLNESNPILTEISNAMTEEGRCEEMLLSLKDNVACSERRVLWEQKRDEATRRKKEGNVKLMECSARYNEKMKAMRQNRSH